MTRLAYVNGRYLPHSEAMVHVEDRGFQFADGVYEVIGIMGGALLDEVRHLDRLERSLDELKMAAPMGRAALKLVIRQLINRNRIKDGLLYLQITRGVASRDFRFPANARSTLVMTAKRIAYAGAAQVNAGIKVITIPDIRWKRCDIKSVALLAPVLGKQQAFEAGAAEAWQVDDTGMVTEGCSSNAWIITANGVLVTRPPSHAILNGITRQTLIEAALAEGLSFEERAFSVSEAYAAQGAFITSATMFVMPVIAIDGRPVGNGSPSLITLRLREAYLTAVPREAV